MTKTTHIDSVDRADLLRLIGIRHIPSLAVFNSGKQGTTVHTVAHLPSFRYAKTVQTACWGPPPIPRQGPLTLPCKRSTSRATTRPYGRRIRGALPTGNKDTSCVWKRPRERTATLSGAIEKAAGGGAFPGFGFHHPTSVLQECIYSCPACHDCFR